MPGSVQRKTIPKPTDRAEWLEARRPYFNASSAAVLYDRHPYVTPGDYAAEKLNGAEQPETDAMRRGRFMEEGIASWWGHDYGVQLVEPDRLYIAGRMMATVDRVSIHDPDVLVEIKTTHERITEPMPYWLDQCQAIMHCYGAEKIELVWVDRTMRMQSQPVDADLAFQAEMAERAEAFMAAIDMDIVPDWVQPSLSASNVTSLYPDPAGEVEVDQETYEAISAYRSLKEQEREIKAALDVLRNEIARAAGDFETLTWQHQAVATFKASKPPTRFDSIRFRDDHPMLADEYLLVGEPTRSLRLVES